MVALGTLISTFWIIAANSWMQTPQGYIIDAQGVFEPADWWAIIFNPSFPYRLAHMVLAAFITTCFVIGGVAAWYLRRGVHVEAAKRMLQAGGGVRRDRGAAADPRRRPARAERAASTSR